MMEWNDLVGGLSALLALLLVWKELARSKRSGLLLRLIFSLLAVSSLACLLLPITYPKQVKVDKLRKIIFVTEGAVPDSVASYLNREPLPVFTNDSATAKALKQFNPKIVSSLSYFLATHPKTVVEVFGYGFDAFELPHLPDTLINFHPSPMPSGFVAVDWRRSLTAGEQLMVQGRYNNPNQAPVKLLLLAFNTTLDSVEIRKSEQNFELTTVPKHAGRAVYSLVALSGRDTLAKEPLPLDVKPTRPHKILLLSASPDFEIKFLKSWLAENGYEVSTRTRISKDKYDQSFYNAPKIDLQHLTTAALKGADLIIADDRELHNLPHGERLAIRAAVETDGVGLLVRADSALRNSFYSKNFPTRVITEKAGGQGIPIQLLSEQRADLQLKEAASVSMMSRSGTQPLATDHRGRIFINSQLLGAGTVAVTTLQSTYQLLLEDKHAQYADLWSSILSRAIKKDASATQWIFPAFPRTDEPTRLTLSTTADSVPMAQVAGVKLSPEQSNQLPYLWQAVFWPERAGWEKVHGEPETEASVFIFDRRDWKSVQYRERLENTRQLASSSKTITGETFQYVKQQQEIPKIYFFLIFLLSCGVLWYETKFL